MKAKIKMTISNSVKAQLFALYLGQPLVVIDEPKENWYPFDMNDGALFLSGILNETIVVRRIAEDVRDKLDQCRLLLRSIVCLTSDEIKTLRTGILHIPETFELVLRAKGDFIVYKKNGEYYPTYADTGQIAYDYLRSIGIALPFTYLDTNHPITLSVQEQVELGIIKLK